MRFLECLKSAWKILYGNNYLWSMYEEIISLSYAKINVFSDSVLCLGKVNQNPTSNTAWNNSWIVSNIHHNTELWTQLTENRWIRSGIFPRIHYTAARLRSPKVHEQNGRTRTNAKDELSSCRCSMTSYGELKTMERNVLLIPHLCLYLQKDFQQDIRPFLGSGSETKWYSTYEEWTSR